MEEITDKAKLRINKCTYRRLNIQHEIDENLRKQTHLSNLHFYRYQEQLFNRKLDHLKKNLEHIQPSVDDDTDDEQFLLTPNCLSRVQNHFRLLNFSSRTEKRLLGRAPSCKNSSKLPIISQKQPRPTTSLIDDHFSQSNDSDDKRFQSYLNQQIIDEENKQMKNNQRKRFLLKEFDELKHTIDDPHSSLSVLAALSRAFRFFESGRK